MPLIPHLERPPAPGSVLVRDDDARGRFEALVVLVNEQHQTWEVCIYSDAGLEPISEDRMRQAVRKGDWRPKNWVYVRTAGQFAPPNFVHDPEKGTWSVNEEIEEDDRSFESSLPDQSLIPLPEDGEHPQTWRARCRRKYPALKSPEGSELLSDVYKEHTK